ncbi:Protein of unknown function DUF2064 [Desulfovibrio sp. X2]|uniref:TIGR04282 family arsenosugar biosynthesis glycosyltransferase n=1 Tax=Desulfovibrio sp. X2 TaxID=941449 RepID=UPI000358B4FC|nr:TIGR04282 family arsenosugar biosynthesis glycosyltransferase [Desulfovibrio sp. X2]EPR39818.1 Protein of unknown function DUF2064 [Desulfovibrio sp. X2]
MKGNRLIVFVKEPRPGRVKTRLIARLGAERAAEFYRAMAGDALDAACGAVTALCRGTGDKEWAGLALAYDPPGAEAAIRAWLGRQLSDWLGPSGRAGSGPDGAPGHDYWLQPGGDLGRRMAATFVRAFSSAGRGKDRGPLLAATNPKVERAVLMGSDLPLVASRDIVRAFELLAPGPDGHDAVLGPCPDGGFWCVGFRAAAFRLDVFDGVPWSTADTAGAALARLKALGMRTALAPETLDVDTVEDVAKLRRALFESPEQPDGRTGEQTEGRALETRAPRTARMLAGMPDDSGSLAAPRD